jgi:hypothetical protein
MTGGSGGLLATMLVSIDAWLPIRSAKSRR